MKNIILKFLLGLIITIQSFSSVYASDASLYFSKKLSPYFSDLTNIVDLRDLANKESRSNILLMSSVLNNIDILSYTGEFNNILIICDSDSFSLNDIICSSTSTYPFDSYDYSNFLPYSFIYNDSRLVLIPQNYIIDPYIWNNMEKYFTDLSDQKFDVNASNLSDSSNKISNMISTLDYDQLLIVFYLLIVSLLSFYVSDLVKKIKKHDSFYSGLKNIFIDYINKLICFLDKYKGISLYILLTFFMMYIFSLSVVSFIDIGSISLDYIIDYIGQSLNYHSYKSKDIYDYLPNLFILFSTYILSIFMFLTFFSGFYRYLIRGISLIIKPISFNMSLKSFLIITFLFFASFPFLNLYTTILLTFLYIVFVIYYLYFMDVNLLFSLSVKSRVYIICFLFVPIFLSFSVNFIYIYLKNTTAEYLDVVSSSKRFVFLPQSIKIKDNTYFKEFLYPYKNILFVDNYLVFHPNYMEIVNLPIDSILHEELQDYYISYYDKELLYEKLLKDVTLIELLNKIVINETYNSLYINKKEFLTAYNSSNPLKIKVSFDCSINRNSKDNIKLALHTISNEYKKDTYKLLNFPGCVAGKKVSYVLDFPELKTSDIGDTIILNIEDFYNQGIIGLELLQSNKPLIYEEFYLNTNSKIVFSDYSRNGSNKLFNYSFDMGASSEPLSFNKYDYTSNKDNFDLGSLLNDIINSNTIDYDFIDIWSPEYGAVLKGNN